MSDRVFRILLVEDSASDAELIRSMLPGSEHAAWEIETASAVRDAIPLLRKIAFDVVILDLHLPDSRGLKTVSSVHTAAPEVPIVVLTGSSHPEGLECIEAGAQDYLHKDSITPRALERSLAFALARRRQAEIGALKSTLERYRMELAGTPPPIPIERPQRYAEDGTARRRHPEVMGIVDRHYQRLLDGYVERLARPDVEEPSEMESVAGSLASLDAGARDLMAVHVQALERSIRDARPDQARAYAIAARSLIIEMMGRLTAVYRGE
jgi:CheY-like chemotaxis protein